MPELNFSLRGTRPAPFAGGEFEKPWWQTLADKAQSIRASRPLPVIPSSASFTVDLVFFLMSKETPGGTELDNLAKPVLDTLFKARKQPPTGALFDAHDTRILKLTLEKRPVSTEEEEGIDITIAWK